eukprot:m51a1_g7453 hypothetical protein (106) ;mRNA; f:118756-119128
MPPIVISGEMGEETSGNPEERLFVFYRCVSFCNSSRLHLGCDVVISLTIYQGDVALASTQSQPLMLNSKTSYKPLPPRGLTWVDLCAEPRPRKGRKSKAAVVPRG